MPIFLILLDVNESPSLSILRVIVTLRDEWFALSGACGRHLMAGGVQVFDDGEGFFMQ